MGSQGYGYSCSPGGFSSSKSERKSKTAGILRVTPCTVSQLLAARERTDSFFIQEVELKQVTVVGLIRKINPTRTHLMYSLDDMTGPPIDVKQWLNLEFCYVMSRVSSVKNDEYTFKEMLTMQCQGLDWLPASKPRCYTSPRRARTGHFLAENIAHWAHLKQDVNMNQCVLPTGTYVKVVGSLRSFQHNRSLVAFNIRRLDDFNEITSHMLEVIQAHLLSDSSSYPRNDTMYSTVINTSQSSDPATIGFTTNQRQVFTLIRNCPSAEGISMQCLKNSLKCLSFYDIRTCLQFLINEGHIFSTVDDYHFKSTYG